ncbi:carbohydrate ABC transporter permease [Ruania halotolerans]|uniref:carbohydrate ABC transporter permease n=1 Tax=Ruania halotolerans TaxID=2897773 RepID=UPI001E3D4320|nr:sugar ABC transporter permease [Ruania halotolerans]UFU04974.1 sugar ABC transporter permease [Ruania halotolerans]
MRTKTATAARAGASPSGRRRPKHKDNRIAFAMIAPAVILLSIFVVWPLVYAWVVSFYQWSFYESSVFVGLRNFRIVLEDPVFWASIGRGLTFSAITVPAILLIAFAFANLVKTMSARMAGVLKVSIYIPSVISFVIASIVFVLIFEYRQGLLNFLISSFGGSDVAWIGSARTALLAISVPAIWIGLGLASLIMLAGLLDIPESYYEAAEMEGANWFQRTFFITIPLMKNILLYVLVTTFVATIQQYELPLVMTQGGPTQSTLLPNLLIFQKFTNDLYLGYPIAAALLLFLVLGAISAVIFKLINSEKAVDG